MSAISASYQPNKIKRKGYTSWIDEENKFCTTSSGTTLDNVGGQNLMDAFDVDWSAYKIDNQPASAQSIINKLNTPATAINNFLGVLLDQEELLKDQDRSTKGGSYWIVGDDIDIIIGEKLYKSLHAGDQIIINVGAHNHAIEDSSGFEQCYYCVQINMSGYLPLTGGVMKGSISFNDQYNTIYEKDTNLHIKAYANIHLDAQGTFVNNIFPESTDSNIGGSADAFNGIYAKQFVKAESDDTHVLLAGGGTKPLSEFAPDLSGYLPLTGGTMTGSITLKKDWVEKNWVEDMQDVDNAFIHLKLNTEDEEKIKDTENPYIPILGYTDQNDQYYSLIDICFFNKDSVNSPKISFGGGICPGGWGSEIGHADDPFIAVYANGFINPDYDENYVLLADGSAKALSEFTPDLSGYLQLAGGTMTGDILPFSSQPPIGMESTNIPGKPDPTYISLGSGEKYFDKVYAREFKGLADNALGLYAYKYIGNMSLGTVGPINVGASSTPVYFNNGVPVACTGTLPTNQQISNWNTAFTWGDHTAEGYVKSSGVTRLQAGDGIKFESLGEFTGLLDNITTEGRIVLDLGNKVQSQYESDDGDPVEGRQYGVGLDKDYLLSVNVPWTDTNTAHSHTAGEGLTCSGDGGTSGTVTYALKAAATDKLGGIKIMNKSTLDVTIAKSTAFDLTSGKCYGVELDKDNQAFVYVPWTNTDTDEKVKQSILATTIDQGYPLLCKQSSGTQNETGSVNFVSDVTVNPSTSTITTPKLNITHLGASGDKVNENVTKPVDNKVLVIGRATERTTCLYINRSGIQAWNSIDNNPLPDLSIPTLRLQGAGGNVMCGGEVNATAFFETSDIRKKEIKSDLSLDKCYDLIDKCQTIIYSLKDQNKEQVGMIAQEIEEFFPEVVATDEEGFKSLAYDRLVVICFKVLKDVIKRLEKLEHE